VLVTEGELSRTLGRQGGGAEEEADPADEPPADAPEPDDRESVSSSLD
jgi:hypothetical protein